MILVLGVWAFLRALLGRSTAVTLENLALRHQLMVLQRSIRALGSAARTASSGCASASSLSSPPRLSLGTAKDFDSTGVGNPDSAHRVVRRSTSRSAA
jgi:hypothetical protein